MFPLDLDCLFLFVASSQFARHWPTTRCPAPGGYPSAVTKACWSARTSTAARTIDRFAMIRCCVSSAISAPMQIPAVAAAAASCKYMDMEGPFSVSCKLARSLSVFLSLRLSLDDIIALCRWRVSTLSRLVASERFFVCSFLSSYTLQTIRNTQKIHRTARHSFISQPHTTLSNNL